MVKLTKLMKEFKDGGHTKGNETRIKMIRRINFMQKETTGFYGRQENKGFYI